MYLEKGLFLELVSFLLAVLEMPFLLEPTQATGYGYTSACFVIEQPHESLYISRSSIIPPLQVRSM